MGAMASGGGAASDELLAERARRGDEAALGALIDRYSRPLFNFALRFLGSTDDAEDIAQQTFVQVYLALPRTRTDLPFRPWIYRIARNLCLNRLRDKRWLTFSQVGRPDDAGDSPLDLVADPEPLPEDLVERADLQQLLAGAIATLPPRYREVVALRYSAELSFAEIAEALAIPENTAKTFFHRAKALLREHLRGRL
jgi:RNA polymerase sigma-70 factor (ECF subfamily)